MTALFSEEFFVIPAFAIVVFILSYLYSDRIIGFFYKRTIGTREEITELMDRMMLDVDKKKITITVLLLSFGLGLVVFLLLWPNVVPGLIFAVAITLLGLQLPKTYLNNLWQKRCNRLVDQMVDGMTIMANGVSAGLSITQSMERVVGNLSGPLSQEFKLVLNKIRLGMSLEEALVEMADRIPRHDVQMFVTSVIILKETGGNLAETFQTINTTVRERQKVEKKIEAMTAQGVTQGIIITLVPFLLLVVFLAIDPAYVMPLFTKPLGWVALFIMLALQVIGGVAMKKIVTIKV